MSDLQTVIAGWVENGSLDHCQVFLRQNLDSLLVGLETDETSPDIAMHLTQQVKTQALSFLFTQQRPKTLELAESLLFFSEILPTGQWQRARKLARARGLMTRFNYRRNTGQFEAAVRDLREALTLCEQCDSNLEAIRCRMGLVHALVELNQIQEAWELAEVTIRQAQEVGDALLLADVLSNIGVAYGNKDEYEEAIEFLTRQLQILLNAGAAGQDSLAQCYYNLALNYLGLQRFQDMLEMTAMGQKVAEKLGQNVLRANNQHMAATAHFHLGQFTKALRVWDEALYLFQHNDCPQYAHWVNYWQCTCLLQLNRLEEALELGEKQISEAQANGWLRDQAQMLYWRARVKAGLDPQSQEALQDYEAAAALFTELDLHNWSARLSLDQAELLICRQAYAEARSVLMRATTEFTQPPMPRGLAQVGLAQARIAQAEGNFEAATSLLRQSLELVKDDTWPALNYRLWQLLGEVYQQAAQPDLALAAYQSAVGYIEKLRGALALELRGDFLKDKMAAYEGLVGLALDRDDLDLAYDYIERAKSRALTEMLASGVDLQIKARSSEDEPLISELVRLRQEYNRSFQALQVSPNILSLRSQAYEADAPRQGELRRYEKQIEGLLLQLQVRNAAYAEDFSLSEVNSESPQSWLDPHTLLIEYYVRGEEVLALAISAREKRVFRHLTSLPKLQVALKKLTLVLQNMPPHLASRYLSQAQAQLGGLYVCLVAPLAEWAANFQHLIFVPHGSLHHLPFGALWNRQSQRYLLEDFDISYLPAASQLRFYCQRANELRAAPEQAASLVLAYSGQGRLAFVPDEGRAVADMLSARLYLEDEVRREVLEELNRPQQVIHLATHGHFREDAPLFSFVELADGTLLTGDLFNLRLPASLVTLSACESGLSKITGGNELLGLSRACLYAGAASLLLSLWQVEDHSTASLMTDFYRRLLQPGQTKVGALRQAQLALLRGEISDPKQGHDYRHPCFWASFCLIGETGPL